MLREPSQGRVWNFLFKNGYGDFVEIRRMVLRLQGERSGRKLLFTLFTRLGMTPELDLNISLADVDAFSGFSAVCKTAATICYDRGHG